MSRVNKTNIVLLPTVKDPRSITQFCPISLCNVLFKILSKTMANRLKKYLPCLILEQQSAFILKQLITDNALVAFEVFHYVKRKTSVRRGIAAIKLDMSKAYDRVEWSFLCGILEKMGFNQEWVNRVHRCISSISYSFMINRKVRSAINPTRGI